MVAGISVALVAIPQSLAYAELAGVPPELGLLAAALPSLLAAAFMSSRYLQTGPVALTALLTLGALQGLATPGSARYVELAALLALLVGAFRIAFGLLRMGGIAYLLSEPVLAGFTAGAGLLIIASQLPKVVDFPASGSGVIVEAARAVGHPAQWSWQAIAFAVATTVVVGGGRRLHRLFPGVLVAIALGTVASAWVGYDGSTLGELDGAFLSLGFDFPWDTTGELLIPAFAIALVGFAEPASIARTFAAAERDTWNANREMISQGVANLAAAVSGAFPVGGSFARTSLNRQAGATSAWSGAITGAFVLVALPFTPVLEPLPRSILGAIVIGAVVKLIRVRALLTLVSQSLAQGVVAVGTLAATLAFSPRVERGVLVGIGLSIGVHLYRELTVTVQYETNGDTLTVRPHGVLWFATVPQIERLVRDELARRADLHHVVIDLGGVGRMDYSGAAALGRTIAEIADAGNDVEIVNVPPGAARAARIHLRDSEETNPLPDDGRLDH